MRDMAESVLGRLIWHERNRIFAIFLTNFCAIGKTWKTLTQSSTLRFAPKSMTKRDNMPSTTNPRNTTTSTHSTATTDSKRPRFVACGSVHAALCILLLSRSYASNSSCRRYFLIKFRVRSCVTRSELSMHYFEVNDLRRGGGLLLEHAASHHRFPPTERFFLFPVLLRVHAHVFFYSILCYMTSFGFHLSYGLSFILGKANYTFSWRSCAIFFCLRIFLLGRFQFRFRSILALLSN